MILLLYIIPVTLIGIALFYNKKAEKVARNGRHPHKEMAVIVWAVILAIISIGLISYFIVTL